MRNTLFVFALTLQILGMAESSQAFQGQVFQCRSSNVEGTSSIEISIYALNGKFGGTVTASEESKPYVFQPGEIFRKSLRDNEILGLQMRINPARVFKAYSYSGPGLPFSWVDIEMRNGIKVKFLNAGAFKLHCE